MTSTEFIVGGVLLVLLVGAAFAMLKVVNAALKLTFAGVLMVGVIVGGLALYARIQDAFTDGTPANIAKQVRNVASNETSQ